MTRQRLELNLARRPFTNDVLLWIGLGLLAAAGLGLSAWNVAGYVATGSQVRELAARRQALDSERREAAAREQQLRRTIETARSELLASRASFANTIIQAHAFSWTRLFNELEKIMPLGVRLMNVRPRVDDGIRVRLNGVARDAASFWELQENLQKWPVFGNVYPDAVQPSATRSGVTAGELLVSLEMEYFPDARALLGLDPDADPLVEAEPSTDPVAAPADDRGPGQEPPAVAGPAEQAAEEAGGTSAGPDRPAGPDPVVRRGRRGKRRPDAVRGGIQRLTPEREGAPGMAKPEIGPATQRPVLMGGETPVVRMTEDGRLVDQDGNIVDVEDIINTPGGIKPGPPPDPSLTGRPIDDPAAAEAADEAAAEEERSEAGGRRRGSREDRP